MSICTNMVSVFFPVELMIRLGRNRLFQLATNWNSLYRQCRLHNRQDDGIEGVELSGAVDTGGLHHLQRQCAQQILPQEEHHHRRGDGRDDQRPVGVDQLQLYHKLIIADGEHLRGHHHHRQDKAPGGFFQLEIVGMDAVGVLLPFA